MHFNSLVVALFPQQLRVMSRTKICTSLNEIQLEHQRY